MQGRLEILAFWLPKNHLDLGVTVLKKNLMPDCEHYLACEIHETISIGLNSRQLTNCLFDEMQNLL